MFKLYILILLSFTCLFAQNYLWPTNASYALTSSFCEYRPGHYHAAIDIKTWNREGYPIYAVDDGSVYRIRVSPFGYGKGLYLKMKDGQIAVYGHLQKFNDVIEKRVFEQQMKNQRYSVHFSPNDIHVKKGTILGYTGQTGIGSPHLHFEIRDKKDRPLNPLKYYNQVKDNIAPVIQSLLVIPSGRSSQVAGSHLPKSYSIKKRKSREYYLNKPISVNGAVGLAFECYDMADGVYNKYAHYKAELFINNQKIFHSQYDRLDFDLTGQVDIDIYFPQKAWHNDVFNKLYIDSYNQLEFYDRSLGNGKIEVDTTMTFRLEVSDYHGNTSYLYGMLIPDDFAEVQMSVVKKTDENIFLNVSFPEKIKHLTFQKYTAGKSWQEVAYYEFLKPIEMISRYNTLVKAKIGVVQVDSLRCSIVTVSGKHGQYKISLVDDKPAPVIFDMINTGNALVLRGQGFFYKHDMNLRLKNKYVDASFQPVFRSNRFEQVIGAEYFLEDTLRITMSGNEYSMIDTTVYLKSFYPDTAMSYSVFDNSIHFDANPKTFFDTMLVSFNQVILDSASHGAILLGPMISMTSNPQVFRNRAELKVKIESNPFLNRQIGFYEPERDGKWAFMGGEVDSIANTLTVNINKICNYITAADTVPPQVEFVPLTGKQKKQRQPLFQLHAKDELSGIGSDKNIFITIDGQLVIPEWDYERDIIACRPHWKLQPGRHEIIAEISDECGNKTGETYQFEIK